MSYDPNRCYFCGKIHSTELEWKTCSKKSLGSDYREEDWPKAWKAMSEEIAKYAK